MEELVSSSFSPGTASEEQQLFSYTGTALRTLLCMQLVLGASDTRYDASVVSLRTATQTEATGLQKLLCESKAS